MARLERGHGVSVDLFGELVHDAGVADRVVEDYPVAGGRDAGTAGRRVAVSRSDLTHLALDADPAGAADRLTAIVEALPDGRRVQVGAEDAARTEALLSCVLDVARCGLAGRLGATLQANLLHSPAAADRLAGAGVHVRLVKGAYVEATGVHPHGEPTDVAFLRLGFRRTQAGATWSMATHDGRLCEALLLALGPVPVEQLLGVRPAVLARPRTRPAAGRDDLRERDVPTWVYVPYGPTGSGIGSAASPSPEAPDRLPAAPLPVPAVDPAARRSRC